MKRLLRRAWPRRLRFSLHCRSFPPIVALLLLLSAAAPAQQVQVTLDPAQTKVNIFVHDVHGGVHGTFQLKSGNVRFDPSSGAASGEVLVDPASGVTGNSTRDRKMKQDVLQTQSYPEVSFRPTRVLGLLAPQGTTTVQVEGVFRIHGADHSLTLAVPVQVNGESVTGTTSFTVPYESWGMKNPSVLFLRVEGSAQVSVSFAGRVVLPPASGGH